MKSHKAFDGSDVCTISFKILFRIFHKAEIEFIKEFLDIDPRHYGFRGRFLGIHEPSQNLIPIHGQKYFKNGKFKKIATQYIPAPTFKAYKKLNQALFNKTGRTLLVESGYRSPAKQILVFLHYLRFYRYDFARTAQRVAMPGYSEHGHPARQAIDFITMHGSPADGHPLDFAKTKEYRWLVKNAHKFQFHLSYPRGNLMGIMFEPWHWRFK
jgi:LAS superfamily LD-carboxypeptidase LdcB